MPFKNRSYTLRFIDFSPPDFLTIIRRVYCRHELMANTYMPMSLFHSSGVASPAGTVMPQPAAPTPEMPPTDKPKTDAPPAYEDSRF